MVLHNICFLFFSDELVSNGEGHPELTSSVEKEKKSKLLMSLEYHEKGLKIEHLLKELNARPSGTENLPEKESKSAELPRKHKGLLVSFDDSATAKKDDKTEPQERKQSGDKDRKSLDKKTVNEEYNKSGEKKSIKSESRSVEKKVIKEEIKTGGKKSGRDGGKSADSQCENKKNGTNKKGVFGEDSKSFNSVKNKENDKNLKNSSKSEKPTEKGLVNRVLKKLDSSGSLETLETPAKGRQKKPTNDEDKQLNSSKKGKVSVKASGKSSKSPQNGTRKLATTNSDKSNKKKVKKSASFGQESPQKPKTKKRAEPEAKKPEEPPPKTREEILREKQKKYNLTIARPFSFEGRDKAYLTKKELLAKVSFV